jgi:hypothetical protein
MQEEIIYLCLKPISNAQQLCQTLLDQDIKYQVMYVL